MVFVDLMGMVVVSVVSVAVENLEEFSA